MSDTPDYGWFGRFNLDGLIAPVGADYWLPEYGPGFPCEKCGGRDVKFQVAYLHPESSKGTR